MKMALAVVISASAPAPLAPNRMRKTSAVLRKLSLKAAKNWHQNKGAKRRDNIRGDGMPLNITKFHRARSAELTKLGTKKLSGLLAAQRTLPKYATYRRKLRTGFAS